MMAEELFTDYTNPQKRIFYINFLRTLCLSKNSYSNMSPLPSPKASPGRLNKRRPSSLLIPQMHLVNTETAKRLIESQRDLFSFESVNINHSK